MLPIQQFIRQTGIPARQERQLRECIRAYRVVAEDLPAPVMVVGGIAEKYRIPAQEKGRVGHLRGDATILLATPWNDRHSPGFLRDTSSSPFGPDESVREVIDQRLLKASVESRVLLYLNAIAGVPLRQSDFDMATNVELLDDRQHGSPSLGILKFADAALLLAISIMDGDIGDPRGIGMRMGLILSSPDLNEGITLKRLSRILKRVEALSPTSVSGALDIIIAHTGGRIHHTLRELQASLRAAISPRPAQAEGTPPALTS